LFQKFNNNKIQFQKSIEFCLLKDKINNNSYNSGFLTFSTSNKVSDVKNCTKNIEQTDNKKTIENDNIYKIKKI
jgi:hypothetical protein